MASQLRRLPVELGSEFAEKPVETSCAGPGPSQSEQPPFLLIHGFDSSCLEWRRLLPLLHAQGAQAWAVDLLGWGFTARDPEVATYSPAAKRAQLRAFIEQHIGRPVVLVGASLGGSAAIDLALEHPDLVAKLVLVDAQAYIDGAAMTGQPKLLQRLGLQVLKSQPLRMFANKIAYADPDRLGTEDAMLIGRLHCLTGRWDEAMMSFMDSGGYRLSARVGEVRQPTLVLWGRNDKILDPAQYAQRFVDDIGPRSRLVWVEQCGHVPHLEQPAVTAQELLAFAAEPAPALV